ncbi:AcrB/AcrD/AcrF family protein [Sphingosinithalassobacter sp. LHW66-3]|uniref:AcrB/AcrD/AcrF family protein n=1 Tax=Sphingosinithalassobacter sp. LHW66-3 TaxID=3424718 RepID=UPI003D6A079A
MKRLGWGGCRLDRELDRHWLRWALLAWAAVAVWYLWQRWPQVQWLALGDTDDNMRLMQVRAWLAGQGWYDLRQYRLDPAFGGFDIHWSRVVDLPLAGLILLFKPFVGTAWAERLASGIAPLLPLAVVMTALSVTARRLIAPAAWPVALIVLMGCTSTMLMFAPLRIDHHGWQLACLAVTVAGLADPRRARGGATVGLSSAVSLTIGLEMLPYCAMAGAIVALRWIWDAAEARRMLVYGLSLGGGSALGFALFASHANQAMRCDALTPVWLSVMVAAGLLLFLLALANPSARWARLGLAAVAGAAILGGFAGFYPQCLGRPEGVSQALADTWLNNVREARPIYRHPLRTAFPVAVLPVIGILGALFATWRWRRSERVVGWAAIALFTAFAAAMLLWQVRAGPAAQMLSVPGATALVWVVVPWCLGHRWIWVRIGGSVAAFLLVSGLFAGFVLRYLPQDPPSNRSVAIRNANASCARFWAMQPLDRLPRGTIFTQVDLGPRLIALTRHNAVAGPYHRNERAILDVHRAFTGSAERARGLIARHQADYLLICRDMSETTVYRARNPNGFYAQIVGGRVPEWLEPISLPENSPFLLFRVERERRAGA